MYISKAHILLTAALSSKNVNNKFLDDLIDFPLLTFKHDNEQVMRAFKIASLAHHDQHRLDGSPYVSHCIEVTKIVQAQMSNYENDDNIMCASLLHDTIEDTCITKDIIEILMNTDVAQLVEGCTKLSKLSHNDAKNDIIHMMDSMKNDWRIIFLKVCDRLHNMRTIQHHNYKQQQKISKQTLKIYVHLADFIGAWTMKNELGEKSLKILNPILYYEIIHGIKKLKLKDYCLQENLIKLRSILDNENIIGDISFRTKTIHSVYAKMQKYGLESVNYVIDINAVRVVIENDDSMECYKLLGYIHDQWMLFPNSIKDYIASPKMNGYKSLHTTVMFGNNPVEIQIRTQKMHGIAEFGAAAHWKYKMENIIFNLENLQTSIILQESSAIKIIISALYRPDIFSQISNVITYYADHVISVNSHTYSQSTKIVYYINIENSDEILLLTSQLNDIEDIITVRVSYYSTSTFD